MGNRPILSCWAETWCYATGGDTDVFCFYILWHQCVSEESSYSSISYLIMYNIRSSRPTLAMHLVFLVLLVPLSEPLPSEIRCNPFEKWLICLSFRYTQSQFLPQRIYHVTSESLTHQMSLSYTGEAKFERSHDFPIIHSPHFPLAFWITICFLCFIFLFCYER